MEHCDYRRPKCRNKVYRSFNGISYCRKHWHSTFDKCGRGDCRNKGWALKRSRWSTAYYIVCRKHWNDERNQVLKDAFGNRWADLGIVLLKDKEAALTYDKVWKEES